MKIIRVDMAAGEITNQEVVPAFIGMGGRGLTSFYVNKEVPPKCDPLGPENMLVFAPGFLSGSSLVNSSRFSIGAKSPLTGGIKESNVGGTVAADMARIGISAIIVEGLPEKNRSYILKIDKEGNAVLLDASGLWGKRTYDLVKSIKETHGENHSITCIGPAGELQLSAASIQSTDMDGRPCRAAGRGGLGAVMGSKGLKALVVEKTKGKSTQIQDLEAFKSSAKIFAQAVMKDEFSSEVLPALGSAVLVEPINAAGAFPTRNARQGQFEDADKISGETMAQVIKSRGGKTTHKGCSGCIINCSNEFVDEKGTYVTSSLEYETIWSMGGMIGNNDLDAIATLDFLCDDIGLDTMSTGVAIAVAMDAGYKAFGDAKAAIEMVEEVATGSDFGKIIGHGPARVGKHFNNDRVPVIKGQSIAAYDPRAIQGMAVTYATSPMGGDHTAGWVVESNLEAFGGTLDPFSAKGQVEVSRNAQLHMAVVDTVGICDFAQTGFGAPDGLENVCKMIRAKSGKPFSAEDWNTTGKKIIRIELEFNKNAGFTKELDRLPKMFYEEPLPPHNKVVVISDEEMDTTFNF
ncbi:aldehyde ferredoxin oxidoreductase family protein [Desulfobacula sp.]|uniref:aldehyde ferredoxin oxidoreductase family protein n=1 Tax=Desulfobacula sp. TaxID=2593537 RepID=UPI001EBE4291|nr:aldehyde ferredoxin oxidoreductase [Desulfobacula sp.]